MKLLPYSILALLMTIFVGVVFHAPLSIFFGSVFPDVQIEIKAWKEILIGCTAVLVIIEAIRRDAWRALRDDRLLWMVAVYSLLHVLLLFFVWQGMAQAAAGLMIDLRFVVFFALVYVTIRLYPAWRKALVSGSIIAAAVSLLFAVLQVTVLPHDILMHLGYGKTTIMPYLTVDQNYEYIRINGTLRGPNPLGVYATIVLAGCLTALLFVRQKLADIHEATPWLVGVLAGCSLVALWFSYSRSAMIATAVAVMVVLVCRYGKRITRGMWFAFGLTAFLILGGVYLARDTPFVSHVILHEDPDEGNAINSNDGHWESLIDGTERMLRQPLGAGIGSTGSPSIMGSGDGLIIENYYLYIAHESGWLGLALFIGISCVVLWRLWLRRYDWLALALFASGIGLLIASLVLPVWADDTVALVWWGLAGVALGTMGKKEREASDGRTVE